MFPGFNYYAAQKSRTTFAQMAMTETLQRRPSVILTTHLNFAPLAWLLARATGARFATVIHGIEAWRRGDLREFGQLIRESGESSIHNYQCGAPPLVDLYHLLVETHGVYGARFSGAGFRGCCLALVDPQSADRVAKHVRQAYVRQHPQLADNAWTMVCCGGDGARFL